MCHNSVIIVGGFHEVIEQVELLDLNLIGIIDNDKKGEYYKYKILGSDQDAKSILELNKEYSIIITPDNGRLREKLFNYYSQFNNTFFTLISKHALVSSYAKIGIGSIICQNTHISSETIIGNFCKINVGANIMHNCTIGDYTTVAPNAVILGNVKIGNGSYIGANATILPNIKIGDNVIVGAGAVVTKNIENDITVMGVPAK